MTLSPPRSTTFGAISAALVWTSLSFGALITPTAAEASTPAGAFYTAELAQPFAKGTTVAGGVAWSCEGTTCTAPRGTSRPLRVCRELNREVGQVATFTAKGEALDTESLARCNS